MTFERFEEILRWKYDNGKKKFIGNLSGNHYEIQNPSGRRCGYSLFIDNTPVKTNISFFGIACAIWDREMEYGKVAD